MLKTLMMKIKNRMAMLVYDLRLIGIPRISYEYDQTRKEGFYGQFGQDKFVAESLGFLKDGVFVDIGANDGVTFSNTYYFEKELGWSGVAIEPLPETFKKLKESRDCDLINGCISDSDGTKTFLAVDGPEMLSGLVEKYNSQHMDRIEKEIEQLDGSSQTIDVSCYTLKGILTDRDINKVHLLSIDTEGGELDILKSCDFLHVDIEMIAVENNYFTQDIRKFLEKFSYELIAIAGHDEIYKKSVQIVSSDYS